MKQLFIILTTIFLTTIVYKSGNDNYITIEKKQFKSQVNSTYELVKKAILNKQSVTCYYNGYLRKMSPHVIGTKNGREQALFYQYGGQSSEGISYNPSRNWRCIFIDKISNLTINNDEFKTANNHSKRHNCVDYTDAVIEY